MNNYFIMKILIFLLFSVIIQGTYLSAQENVNQKDANGHKQGKWIGKYSNGKIRYEGSFADDKPAGEWKRYHENGKIKARMFHRSNSDKVAAELFDENGIRYAKGNYMSELKDSTWNYYNNLRLVGKESFTGGKKNGLSLSFFENGIPDSESNWVNGVLDGVSRSFYPSGKKKTEMMYREGKRQGLSLVYYESGQTEISGQYYNDLADGNWKFTNGNGVTIYELKYKSGVLLNPEVMDSIQAGEFKAFDRARGKLKDPENFSQNPDEYLRK
jgi:antitoxin component YwqK of YwqJK toxin-antitoxin module